MASEKPQDGSARPGGAEQALRSTLGSASEQRPDAQMAPHVPDHELIRCIGRGGYGEVWLARNVMGTYRAVKAVYRASFDHDRPFEREFEGIRHFEPVSRTHESQLNVLHVGRGEGYFYYVMELADDQGGGQNIDPRSYAPRTLRSDLHQLGRLPFEQCLRIALALTTALEHLHQHGLVHRDIKPSNVIFVGGVPKLADIGLVAEADATLSFVGTEGYVPPEGPGSPRADLYSLGKLLYETNTGRDRQDYPELPTDLRQLSDRERIIELNEVILKACQPDVRRRYANAGEMHADLVLLQGGKSLARVHAMERRLAKWKQVGRVGAAACLVIAAGFFWQRRQAQQMSRLAAVNLELAKANREKAEESRRRLARTEIITGARLLDQGDWLGSLPWFCGAATLDLDDPQREAADLFRLRSVLGQSPKLTKMFFHDARIGVSAFDSEGKYLVTGSADRTARVWDLSSGQLVGRPLKHENEIMSASFSPEADRLATASGEKSVRVWDIPTGRLLFTLGHPDLVFYVAFSSSGNFLLTVSRDGQRVWNARTEELLYPVVSDPGMPGGLSPDGRYFVTIRNTARVRELATGRLVFETSPSEFSSVAFSPDSKRIVTGGSDGVVQVWEIANGQRVGEAMQNASAVDLIRFSRDGRRLVARTPAANATVIWNLRDGHAVSVKHPPYVYIQDAEFSPDGRYLATGGSDGVARLWNAATGEAESASLPHGGPVLQVKFSAEGDLLLTAGLDGAARLWNLAEMGFFVRAIRVAEGLNYGEFNPDDSCFVTSSRDGTVRVWDSITGGPLGQPMRHGGGVSYAAFSHDGRMVVTASNDNTARVWNWLAGQPLTEPLPHNGPVVYARFSADDRLVVTTSEDGTARLWNTVTGQPVGVPLQHEGLVRRAALSPGNEFALTVSDNRTARLWEVATGKCLTPHAEQTYQVADQAHVEFSPDGRHFLTVQEFARVWEVATGQPVTGPLTSGSAETYATFSPDGRRVATAAQDGTAQIWDAATGQALTAPMRHLQAVWRVAFDKTGERLATASLDKTARIWDARNGDPLTAPLRHEDKVVQVAFSADGRRLLTLTPRGVTRIWDLSVSADSLERVERLVELVADRRTLPETDASPLSRQELHEAWKALPGDYKTATASPQVHLRWHEREAFSSELGRQWEAAIFHLNHLLAAHPDEKSMRQRRATAFDRAGDWQKAVADDPSLQRSIPLRNPQAPPELIDLSAYYNWPLSDFGEGVNNLASLGSGTLTFGGVQFDARGAIHLTDPSGIGDEMKTVSIPLHRKCARLHFLHAAVFGSPQLEGRVIGKYVIHYATDGQQAELPVIYGQHLLDWHCLPGESWAPKDLEVVWKGTNQMSIQNRSFIRLFKTTWENPNPAGEIGSLELVPEPKLAGGASPFVVGITADPVGTPKPSVLTSANSNRGILPQIQPRDPRASPDLIDLSMYYNASLFQDVLGHKGHNLARLPKGLQAFGGVPFDVRGMIRLAGAGEQVNQNQQGPWDDKHGYPNCVKDIPINRKAKRLTFLQASMGLAAPPGTKIGSYLVHFASGQEVEFPIIYGEDTAHWTAEVPPKVRPVWTGSGPVPDFGISTKRLFKQTIANPFPDLQIQSLDFVSDLALTTAPFLIAITVN